MLKLITILVLTLCVATNYAKKVKAAPIKFENDFLIGVSSACAGFDRRQLIRESNIDLYKARNPGVTWRFMLLNPNNDTLREQIMHENKTHGDIIILEKHEDSKKNAIWLKPYEFFKYVEQNMSRYRYVAKMDDDTFLNITGLYEHIFTEKVKHQKSSIIAAWHVWLNGNIKFPHGGIYALSWDLVPKMNHLYDTVPLNFPDAFEDVQIAIYLNNASISFNRVGLDGYNCNYKTHDRPTGMSKCNLTHQHLNEFSNIVRVHLLKDEAVYRNITSYFIKHENELNMKALDSLDNLTCNDTSVNSTECDEKAYEAFQSKSSDPKYRIVDEL